MKITKGSTSVEVPNWALLVGVLVVDNVICNICKTVQTKSLAKVEKAKES